MVTPEPASSAAPGLRTRSALPSPQQVVIIARQRGRVAFAVLLSIGAVVSVLVDEAGRWTEATPLGFTVGDNGHVQTVDQHGGAAAVSTLKARFPMLAVTTVAGKPLWRQLPHNRPAKGIVVDGAGAVWRRLDAPTVELRFFAGAQMARGGWVDGCPEEPHVQSDGDDDGLVTADERAACTKAGRPVVFGQPTTTATTTTTTTTTATTTASLDGGVRLVRIPGGGTMLWAGLLLSTVLASVGWALVRGFSRSSPDDDEGREALRRRSILAVVLAAGLVVPLLAHAGFMVVAASANLVSMYAVAALVTTALPHLLLMFHLRRSATDWLAGRFATTPLTAPIVVAAATPGLVLLIPTVTVLVVAALLHLALRRWAHRVLSDDARLSVDEA